MTVLRYVVCCAVAFVFGLATYLAISKTGLAGAGNPTGSLWSDLIIYPGVILMGCFGFWIVYSVSDPGTGK